MPYDELYDAASRLVVKKQKASHSLLQRALKIGFSRASALLHEMAKDGLVTGTDIVTGQRSVLVKPDYFVAVDAELARTDPAGATPSAEGVTESAQMRSSPERREP